MAWSPRVTPTGLTREGFDEESHAAAVIPTGAPEATSLPPEMWNNILGRMSIPELSKAVATSEAIAVVGADILHRRAERARRALCPPGKESLCEGSLLCAIAANDDDAVRNILLARHTTPGRARQLCGMEALPKYADLIDHMPCRILVASSRLFTAKALFETCKEASWENVACGSGAYKTLAMIIPDVMKQPQSGATLGRLLDEAITSMGCCVWFGYYRPFPGGDLKEEGDDLIPHYIDLHRAASAVSWEGQRSAMPVLHGHSLDAEFYVENEDGGVSWKVEIYNAPAVVHAVLGSVLPSMHRQLTVGGEPFWNPLNACFDVLHRFIQSLTEWMSQYYEIEKAHGPDEAREEFARGMPRAYVQTLQEMRPFFDLRNVPQDILTEKWDRDPDFLLGLRTLRDRLSDAVTSLTGWPHIMQELFDAGFVPNARVLVNLPSSERNIPLHLPPIARPGKPVRTALDGWLDHHVFLDISNQIRSIAEDRLGLGIKDEHYAGKRMWGGSNNGKSWFLGGSLVLLLLYING